MFVRNKSIINTFLTVKPLFLTKYESSIHKFFFPAKKSSHLNQEWNLHRSKTVLNKSIGEFWYERTTVTLSLVEALLLHSLKLKSLNDIFVSNIQHFSSEDINWWTGVVWITCGILWCFYQLFGLSFWRHPFTAEHPLLRQWCNDTFLQIWWRNKLIYILDELRRVNVPFWVNYSFNDSD